MSPISRAILAVAFTMSCGLASAADYARYRVIGAVQLNLTAGPSDTAALLSPDGRLLLHVGAELCLLEPVDAHSWKRIGCTKNSRGLDLRAADDLLWSPRSDRLVLPTYVAGLLHLRDTDIRLLDPATLTVINLTDDGLDDSLLDYRTPGNFDLTARWIDDHTLAFLRYPLPRGGGAGKGGPPSLMTVDAAGGEPKPLFTIPGADRLAVHALAVSADGRRIAYSFDKKGDTANSGIHVLEIGKPQPERVADTTGIGKPPVGLAFSADGKFLLLIGNSEVGIDARVLDLETGKVVPVDGSRKVTGVAWSPTGSALAYVTFDRGTANAPGGLFLASRPGAPARQLLKQALMPPVCCGRLPFIWAANDTMVLGNVENPGAPLFVRLGE